MPLTKDVEVLRSLPLFAEVEPAKLKLLAFTSERLQYLAGEELFHQGDHGDSVHIVLDGMADILVDSPDGAVRVETVRKSIVGEIAVLCDVPRTATVVAQGDVATLRMSREGFFQVVTRFPQVGIEVMSELASRLHHTTQALAAARRAR